jgi:hypothetical protein
MTSNPVYLISTNVGGGCDQSSEDAYSCAAPDPTSVIPYTLFRLMLAAGVTSHQRMLTPVQHLILPLLSLEVCVSLIFTVDWFMYLLWALIMTVTADFSLYLAGLTDFDSGLFHSPKLNTLNVTTDIWIWNRAYGGCDRSAGSVYSSAVPDHFVLSNVLMVLCLGK